MSNRKFKSQFLFLLILSLLFIFDSMILAKQNGSDKIPFIAEKVRKQTISQQLQTSGEVLPYQGADIHPKTNGEIIKVNVREGDRVQPGDLLAEVDHRILDAQVEQARAAVAVAKAAIDAQEVLVKTSHSGLVSAKAQAEAIKAQVTNLEATRNRFQELFKEGAISQQQLDDVIAKHDAAKAQLVAAESGIMQAKDNIQTAKVTLIMRKAQLLQAKSNLNSAEVSRENAFVRAPFTGIVTHRFFDEGAMANAAKPIIRLEQMNPVKVIGSLVEKDLMLLNENETPATIHADSAKITFQGKVNKVYPAIVSKSRTGQFEILLDNPELKLRSGMYATINLFMKTEKDATVVSKDALLTHAGQYMAIKINNDGTAERVKLKLGIVQGDNAQVLEGLQPGDTIVSQSPELVKVGTKVRPIFSEAEK